MKRAKMKQNERENGISVVRWKRTGLYLSVLVVLILLGNLNSGIGSNATELEDGRFVIVKDKPNEVFDVDTYRETYGLDGVRYELLQRNRSNFFLKVGNTKSDIVGVQLPTENVAIHLLYCNKRSGGCTFRVNGDATGMLFPQSNEGRPSAIRLESNYLIVVESIDFDFCDHRRYCDRHFQSYDVVNVSIIRTKGAP